MVATAATSTAARALADSSGTCAGFFMGLLPTGVRTDSGGVEHAVLQQQAFEGVLLQRLGDDEHLVVVDGVGQLAVFVGLGAGRVPLDDGLLLISARCTSLSRGTKWIICVPSCWANSSIISRSLSTLRLLQIRPPSRTTPALANFTMPLQMLLAAYIAIISPEQTM